MRIEDPDVSGAHSRRDGRGLAGTPRFPCATIAAVPDLLHDGQSWADRLRTRRRRHARDARRQYLTRKASFGKLIEVLTWNKRLLDLVLVERTVWQSDQRVWLWQSDHRVWPLQSSFAKLLSGSSGSFREFLSRCQDADQRIQHVATLTSVPGHGEALTARQEQEIREAIEAIDRALALADEAARALALSQTPRPA